MREAVVTAREDRKDDAYLAAYFVTEDGRAIPSDSLRAHCAERLPSYMVPSLFVHIDRPAPHPEQETRPQRIARSLRETSEAQGRAAPPRSEAELRISGIWRELLGIEEIGTQDNFFDLGGTSLLASLVAAQIRQVFDCDISVIQVLQYPTIDALAHFAATGFPTIIGLRG